MKKKTLTLAILALFVLTAVPLTAADQAPGKNGARDGNHANLIGRLNQRRVRINKRIDKLNDCLAKHPQCPDNIKADINKLTGDLDTQQNNVGTLIGCLQKKDKEAAKAQHAVVKQQREVIKADCAQLKADRQAYRATRQAAGAGDGQRARKGKGNGQGQGKGEGQPAARQGRQHKQQ